MVSSRWFSIDENDKTEGTFGVLGNTTTLELPVAYYNVKRLQIGQLELRCCEPRSTLALHYNQSDPDHFRTELSNTESYYMTMICGEILSMRSAHYVGANCPTRPAKTRVILRFQVFTGPGFVGVHHHRKKYQYESTIWYDRVERTVLPPSQCEDVPCSHSPMKRINEANLSREGQPETGHSWSESAGLVTVKSGAAEQWQTKSFSTASEQMAL